MASVNECLVKIQEITQQNLDILKTFNDAFFTKQDHLSVSISGSKYIIPSFISLENKVNSLAANLENLINAPQSGEAYFNFDGNSRSISVRPYTSTPNSLVLNDISNFSFENNDIFKDFIFPNAYINIGLQTLPNDITHVNVKKIVPLSGELKEYFKATLTKTEIDEEGNPYTIDIPSNKYSYKNIHTKLLNYKEDVDYIEYDTMYTLPIRKNIGSGVYVIESIKEDIIDENLDNYITVKLRSDMNESIYRNNLSYLLFDEIIERPLKIGDTLITYEGNAKVEIVELYPNTNSIKFKVLFGEYLNLVPSDDNKHKFISPLSKLKFDSPIDFDEDKYIKVSLEEDKYIFVAVAPVNDRMNIQSSWGSGLMLNTYLLTHNNGETFEKFYKDNVKNIGDVMMEVTSAMNNTNISKYTKEEFEQFTKFKPIINTNNLLVTRINKHLDNSPSLQNIRALYSQKKDYQSKLEVEKEKLRTVSDKLANISYDDTTGQKKTLEEQFTTYNNKVNELTASINSVLTQISNAANDSEVPIENAKYRIRGFFDYKSIPYYEHIKGIKVQYRYKNKNQEQGQVLSINGDFIFSDWNNMESFDRTYKPVYDSGYKFNMEEDNGNYNEPSFNQIDIPISQGETVDIRLKVVYDFGAPFIETTSSWSEIVNIGFPEEFLKDIQITDIITENNNEIETYKFSNMLINDGITNHVNDKIQDQDILYHHKSDNIASGFYTSERRIIPLKDKLVEMSNNITAILDEIKEDANESLQLSLSCGTSSVILEPLSTNYLDVLAYDNFTDNVNMDSDKYNGYEVETLSGGAKYITAILNLTIYNNSNHITKLYSLFPGNKGTIINFLNTKYIKDDYSYTNGTDYKGVWMKVRKISSSICDECGQDIEGASDIEDTFKLQSGNQYITFRIKDAYSSNSSSSADSLYVTGDKSNISGMNSLDKEHVCYENNDSHTGTRAYIYPLLYSEYDLCIGVDGAGQHIKLNPYESINIPIVFEYKIEGNSSKITKYMSFDLRPSIYKDPITYKFGVTAKYSDTPAKKAILTYKKPVTGIVSRYNDVILRNSR